MFPGRHTCNTLKAIRKKIAEANDIKYEPRECTHEGDCAGTCPACEAEVRYIEGELSKRRRMGKKVAVAGIAVGMAGLAGCGIGRIIQPPLAGIPVMPPEPTQPTVAADSIPEPELMGKPPVIIADSIRPVENGEEVLTGIVEESPQFPGGDQALLDYIKANIRIPDECVTGRVVVTFLVGKDGSISDARVVRSLSEACDKEALRLVNSMPKWKPGCQVGQRVDTRYTLPIPFISK